MSSSVDQIKSKIDIVSLVSSYIKLEKAGANFKGRCPFHNEKTPSFFVSPDRGTYYCFGCQAKGDIFTFVQEFEGLDFIGSLKVLADRAGVALENYSAGEKTEKQKLHSVLEQAVFFYEKNLSENKLALDYLHDRGVSHKTIKEFRLGFAPAEWRSLFDYLSEKGVSEKDMLLVGLIKRPTTEVADSSLATIVTEGKSSSATISARGSYDTFRGRIMFPINDSSGRVVGFSGRILVADDKSPKYLNSPETVLFNKSEVLFGLDKAKKDIRLRDYSILVEGQMDLIMLHQAGLTNTVASSGTALTEGHLVKLNRLSNRIIMSYDGDEAGFSASDRSSKLALSLGMELKLAVMPEGFDPADLVQKDTDKLKESLKNSKHIIDFYTDNLLARGLDSHKLGQEIRKKVLPYITLLTSTIEKDHFIKNIAKKTFIKEESLWEDLKQVQFGKENILTEEKRQPLLVKRMESLEKRVLGIILWQRENRNKEDDIDIIEIEKRVRDILGEKMEELLNLYLLQKDVLLFEIESYYAGKKNLKRDIDYLLSGLEEEYLKREFTAAMANLQKAEQSKDEETISKYLKECQELSQKINKIKNNG